MRKPVAKNPLRPMPFDLAQDEGNFAESLILNNRKYFVTAPVKASSGGLGP